MEKSQYAQEDFLRLIVRLVVEELCKWERSVPIGVSNRHVHLNRADMDTLFGEGSELTRVKDLGQPGQYAAAEVVTSQGSKGELKRMRVLGPLRGESQVEVSIGDGFVLGVHPPVRESGQLEGTPGIKMVGPNGEVEVKRGVIAALRHIHLDPATAERMGVHDKQVVRVEIGGLRGAILNNVLLRVSDQYAPEMHIDVEEANALGVKKWRPGSHPSGLRAVEVVHMGCDMAQCNKTLLEFERLIKDGGKKDWEGTLRTGIDLGTANIVLAVVDEKDRPVAGATFPSTVVRDGIVVDYIGAVRAVTELKAQLERLLGTTLDAGACAIPPGILSGNVKAIGNVVESAGFRLTEIVDEPTAAAAVLGITDGAVVDVGGGTTGISILEHGKVIDTSDEPTGGTHMTLVLAGFYGCSTEEAEEMKRDAAQEANVFPIVRPVVEKMASIVKRSLEEYPVDTVYVVGGACCFTQFEEVFEKYLAIPVVKPAAPLLVTPLGIAMNCTE